MWCVCGLRNDRASHDEGSSSSDSGEASFSADDDSAYNGYSDSEAEGNEYLDMLLQEDEPVENGSLAQLAAQKSPLAALRCAFRTVSDDLHSDEGKRSVICLCEEAYWSPFGDCAGLECGASLTAEYAVASLEKALLRSESKLDSMGRSIDSPAIVCEIARALQKLHREADCGNQSKAAPDTMSPGSAAPDFGDGFGNLEADLQAAYNSPQMALQLIETLLPILFEYILLEGGRRHCSGTPPAEVLRPADEEPDTKADTEEADEPIAFFVQSDNRRESGQVVAARVNSTKEPTSALASASTSPRILVFLAVVTGLCRWPSCSTSNCGFSTSAIELVIAAAGRAIQVCGLRSTLMEEIDRMTNLPPARLRSPSMLSIAGLLVVGRTHGDRLLSTDSPLALLLKIVDRRRARKLLFRLSDSSTLLKLLSLYPSEFETAPVARACHQLIFALLAGSAHEGKLLHGLLLDVCAELSTGIPTSRSSRHRMRTAAVFFEVSAELAVRSHGGSAALFDLVRSSIRGHTEALIATLASDSDRALFLPAVRGLCVLALCEHGHAECPDHTSECLWQELLEIAELEALSANFPEERSSSNTTDGVNAHFVLVSMLLMLQAIRSRTHRPSENFRSHLATLFRQTKSVLIRLSQQCLRWCARTYFVRSLFLTLDIVTYPQTLPNSTLVADVCKSLEYFCLEQALDILEDALRVSNALVEGDQAAHVGGYENNPLALQVDEAVLHVANVILQRLAAKSRNDPVLADVKAVPEASDREARVIARTVALFGSIVYICARMMAAFKEKKDLFEGGFKVDALTLQRIAFSFNESSIIAKRRLHEDPVFVRTVQQLQSFVTSAGDMLKFRHKRRLLSLVEDVKVHVERTSTNAFIDAALREEDELKGRLGRFSDEEANPILVDDYDDLRDWIVPKKRRSRSTYEEIFRKLR